MNMIRRTLKGVIPFSIFCIICALSLSADAAGPTSFEAQTLAHINQYRAQHGLTALHFDMRLQNLAREHSSYMYSARSLGHQNFMSRYGRSGSRGCTENVGWNSRSAYEQFSGWRDSSGHRQNMLDGTMRRAGVSRVGAFVTFFACI
jgi:uncharacterized protein YkwD